MMITVASIVDLKIYRWRLTNMADRFTSYEGNAVLWIVYHNHGTTHVHATTESIALARFMAKYPTYQVKDMKRA